MKKILIAIISIIVVAGLFFLFTGKDAEVVVEENMASYVSPELGFSFKYKTGVGGYEIQERYFDDGDPNFLRTIVLVRTEDLEKDIPVGGEGPATITISVFKNPKKQFSGIWADQNTRYSNINLKTSEIDETVVGEANAVRYMADGLYASENFVVAHGGLVYVITGMFIDADSDLRKDFKPLVESIKFIPLLEQM